MAEFPPQSNLLDLALHAHGLDRWRTLTGLSVHLRVGGNILASRFKSPFTRALQLEIDTRTIRATLRPFPIPGQVGVFEGDVVRIEAENGETVAFREGARAHAIAHRFWDDLDLLYFLGYALWNYAMSPFLFQWEGFSTREIEPFHDGRRQLRRLEVRYPDGFPTHCQEQVYYFDLEGVQRRLDYVAEVLNPRIRGAHLCEDPRDFSGILFPTHRVVYPVGRDLRPWPWVSAMEGWVDDVQLLEERREGG